MARRNPNHNVEGKPTRSSIAFNTKVGPAIEVGSNLADDVAEYGDKNGYLFQQSLTLYDYDITVHVPYIQTKMGILYDKLNKKYGANLRITKEQLMTYLEMLYLVTAQTAYLGKILAAYGNDQKDANDISHFNTIFGTMALGNTDEARYVTTLNSNTSNPLTDGTMFIYHTQMEIAFKNLVNRLNQLPDPLGLKERIWNTIRFVYRDRLDSDREYFSLVPKCYPLMSFQDEHLYASKAETWAAIAGAELPVYFNVIYDMISDPPKFISDTIKAVSRMNCVPFTIMMDIDELFRTDSKLSTSIHNAKLGNYFSRHRVSGSDAIQLDDYGIVRDYMDKCAVAEIQGNESPSTLIDESPEPCSDYDYIRFADIWYQSKSNLTPASYELITSAMHIYSNSPTEASISSLITHGVVYLEIENEKLHSALSSVKGTLAHISMLLQMRSAPLTQIKYVGKNSTTAVGWNVWMWRCGRTREMDESQFDSLMAQHIDEMFDRIVLNNQD